MYFQHRRPSRSPVHIPMILTHIRVSILMILLASTQKYIWYRPSLYMVSTIVPSPMPLCVTSMSALPTSDCLQTPHAIPTRAISQTMAYDWAQHNGTIFNACHLKAQGPSSHVHHAPIIRRPLPPVPPWPLPTPQPERNSK